MFTFLKKLLRNLILISGVLSILMLILSFTTLPFWGYYWLGTSAGKDDVIPEYIIVMGGSGMPGKSGLIRSYYAFRAAEYFPNAKVIISLPGETNDNFSSVNLMKKELTLRGIEENRISLEAEGKNTRDEVLEIKKMISGTDFPVIVVTSPEHMRRAILAFQKVGFSNIGSLPAFDNPNEAELFFNDIELGGKNRLLPEIGGNIQIRYQFWKHLEYEILFLREITAMGYYKLKGWI